MSKPRLKFYLTGDAFSVKEKLAELGCTFDWRKNRWEAPNREIMLKSQEIIYAKEQPRGSKTVAANSRGYRFPKAPTPADYNRRKSSGSRRFKGRKKK